MIIILPKRIQIMPSNLIGPNVTSREQITSVGRPVTEGRGIRSANTPHIDPAHTSPRPSKLVAVRSKEGKMSVRKIGGSPESSPSSREVELTGLAAFLTGAAGGVASRPARRIVARTGESVDQPLPAAEREVQSWIQSALSQPGEATRRAAGRATDVEMVYARVEIAERLVNGLSPGEAQTQVLAEYARDRSAITHRHDQTDLLDFARTSAADAPQAGVNARATLFRLTAAKRVEHLVRLEGAHPAQAVENVLRVLRRAGHGLSETDAAGVREVGAAVGRAGRGPNRQTRARTSDEVGGLIQQLTESADSAEISLGRRLAELARSGLGSADLLDRSQEMLHQVGEDVELPNSDPHRLTDHARILAGNILAALQNTTRGP
jgi:hypothetical protein